MATKATAHGAGDRGARDASPAALTGSTIGRRLGQDRGYRPEDRLATGIGAEVRRQRRRRGLSQAALAAAVGRDRSTVSRWEAGERLPTLAALVALARALRCDPAALLPGGAGEE